MMSDYVCPECGLTHGHGECNASPRAGEAVKYDERKTWRANAEALIRDGHACGSWAGLVLKLLDGVAALEAELARVRTENEQLKHEK